MNQSKINGAEEVSRDSERMEGLISPLCQRTHAADERRGWRLARWDEEKWEMIIHTLVMGRTWTWSHWRQSDRKTQREKDKEAVTENSEGNKQQQHSDHHRGGKKSTELKTNWLRSKQSRYRSKYSWAEIPSVIRRHNGALYGHIWGGGGFTLH